MLKQVLKGIVIGAAALTLGAGAAAADTYDLNMYGASAQHKFWNALAPSFLDAQGCDTVNQYSYDKKHGMAIGEQCDVPDGTDDSTIIIRYSSRASYDGMNAVRGVNPDTDPACTNPDEREMCNDADNCQSLSCQSVNLGASDVCAGSLAQATSGWEDGDQSFPNDPYVANSSTLSFPTNAEMGALEQFNPIVVPFAFFVNNTATEYRCTEPGPGWQDGIDYANHMTSCVPQSVQAHCELGGAVLFNDPITGDPIFTETQCLGVTGAGWVAATSPTPRDADGPSWDCVGYYQCDTSLPQGDNDGTCTGGARDGLGCDKTYECPDDSAGNTACTEMPIVNVNKAMVRQIFSNQVLNWSDFGAEYTDCPIVKCMRHAGSGTHATFDLEVMDGVTMVGGSIPVGANPVWHFTSSSDLLKCVDSYDCAIGYMDADKLLGSNIDNEPGLHMVLYNGAKASRRNIRNGIYEFWAAQHVYYDSADFGTGSGYDVLLSDLIAFSTDAANLTFDTLGYPAFYWASQGEMSVSRGCEGETINR